MDDRTLEAMVEHVAYEIDMLQATAILLRTGMIEGRLKNAVLESTLVHLRLVDEFLAGSGGRSDDVSAIDYLPTWAPRNVLTEDERRDVNKRVHHLTTRRIGQSYMWPLALCEDAVRACVDFLTELEREEPRRGGWFRSRGVDWLKLEEAPAGQHEVGS